MMYDLVVKNGILIDPSEGVNERKDIAVLDGKVAAVERRISSSGAKRTLDVSGCVVTPGLIDMHAHVAYDLVRLSVDPDASCLMKGTTTVVDAGSTGELLLEPFKRFVIGRSVARVLVYLNIESLGMVEFTEDRPRHTDQEWPELLISHGEKFAPLFINKRNTLNAVRRNTGLVAGIKWAHHGFGGLRLAKEVAVEARTRLMTENHHMPEALRLLTKGDIVTHIYHNEVNRVNGRIDGLTEDGTIREEFFSAVRRGVVLDVGHGRGSFSWTVADLAVGEGLPPHTISTDLWVGNVKGPVYDQPTTMAKFLHLGMDIEEVVRACTETPAEILGLEGAIGTLAPGASADVAAFRLQRGRFPLLDSYGQGRLGSEMLVPTAVVKEGEIVRGKA